MALSCVALWAFLPTATGVRTPGSPRGTLVLRHYDRLISLGMLVYPDVSRANVRAGRLTLKVLLVASNMEICLVLIGHVG